MNRISSCSKNPTASTIYSRQRKMSRSLLRAMCHPFPAKCPSRIPSLTCSRRRIRQSLSAATLPRNQEIARTPSSWHRCRHPLSKICKFLIKICPREKTARVNSDQETSRSRINSKQRDRRQSTPCILKMRTMEKRSLGNRSLDQNPGMQQTWAQKTGETVGEIQAASKFSLKSLSSHKKK